MNVDEVFELTKNCASTKLQKYFEQKHIEVDEVNGFAILIEGIGSDECIDCFLHSENVNKPDDDIYEEGSIFSYYIIISYYPVNKKFGISIHKNLVSRSEDQRCIYFREDDEYTTDELCSDLNDLINKVSVFIGG